MTKAFINGVSVIIRGYELDERGDMWVTCLMPDAAKTVLKYRANLVEVVQ